MNLILNTSNYTVLLNDSMNVGLFNFIICELKKVLQTVNNFFSHTNVLFLEWPY